MVRQAIPLKPMEVHGGPDVHPQPMERGAPVRAAECPKEAVTLWTAYAEAGSLQDLWPHGELEWICWQDL